MKQKEITPWHELNKIERKEFLETWSKKWYWENTSQIIETSTNNKLP